MNRIFLLACYAFVSIGISASLIGPALPTLASRSQISLDQTGYLFTSMAVGYVLSAPLINWLRQRVSARSLLIVSPWLVILCMALLAFGRSFALQALGTFALGLGHSGTQVGYIVMFGEGKNASGVLNRLNAFFGIGALFGPVLASLGYTLFGDATLAFVSAAVAALPLSIGMLLLRNHGLADRRPAEHSATPSRAPQSLSPWRSSGFWLMILVMGFYVGCEVSFTGWVTEFTRRGTGVSIAQAALSTSAFFVGMTISRYVLENATRRISPLAYVAILLAVAAIAMISMVLSQSLWLMLLGSFAIGYGFGPIYPTLIAVGIQRFPRFATLITSTLTSAGSIGAVVLPALTGILITQTHQRAWLLLIGVVLIVGLGWQLIRRDAGKHARSNSEAGPIAA